MKNYMKAFAFLAHIAVGTVLMSLTASAALVCPTTSSTNTDCGYLITIAANGSITGAAVAGAEPYDSPSASGGDDALIGVINHMTTAFTGTIALTGSGNGGGIFEFDGDGICNVSTLTTPGSTGYCASASTGYEGPLNTFSNIHSVSVTDDSGNVNITGLGAGQSTYFSLESAPNGINISVSSGTPEPATFGLIGLGLTGLYFIRRRAKA